MFGLGWFGISVSMGTPEFWIDTQTPTLHNIASASAQPCKKLTSRSWYACNAAMHSLVWFMISHAFSHSWMDCSACLARSCKE